ncbi:hypothetical protein Q4340_18585, partial [Acinetobacter baumannii]
MSESTLWAVAMRPEGDSPFKQTPAASKEIAERAVDRYRKMHEKEGNNFFLEIFDDVIKVQKWHGTRKDGTVAKLAMRQPFVLFKGLTFQKLCLPGAFRPGDHHN